MTRWLDDYGSEITSRLTFSVMPFKDYWNAAYYDETNPAHITHDPREGAPASRFWWSGTQSEVSQYIASYQSRWLPAAMFDRPEVLAALMFEASRHNWFALHLNKGLSGQSPASRARDEQTAIHPAAFDAAALILSAQTVQHRYPGVAGFEPDAAALTALRQQVDDCMGVFRQALPDAGSYMNEADYFEADWQNQFWGVNYERLLRIKQDVDPGNLFTVHHGVGSEERGLR